jgi:nucleoside 2-deoxyribosyltransferase
MVTRIAARLMENGMEVFCPIAHSHAVAEHLPDALRYDHEFWMKQDLPILDKCDMLIIAQLEGWKESKGVREEFEFATKKNLPIGMLDPVAFMNAPIQPIPDKSRIIVPELVIKKG